MEFYHDEFPAGGIDTAYIGDVVCHERNILSNDDLQSIVKRLHRQGIKVCYSTLALCTTPVEIDYLKEVYRFFDGIEINMLGFMNLLKNNRFQDLGKKIVLGPHLNIYNWKSAAFLKKFNPSLMVAPFELTLDSITDIIEKASIPMEITAWGNVSVALSWRCYTARAVGRTREECGKVCFEYPEGMTLKTVENEELFLVDGLQVKSAKTYCLVESLPRLINKGISSFRIYPHREHTTRILDVFRQVLAEELDHRTARTQLAPFAPSGFCNGWLFQKAGWEYAVA